MAKENKQLVTIAGANMARTHGAVRAIKMLQPIHAECQWPYRPEWWKRCEAAGHEPYITKQETTIEVPVYEPDEEGDMVLKEVKTKKKLVSHPNVTQVVLDAGHNDGRGPERFARRKGFKQLEELGYAPLCQMLNCWQPAKITTSYGEYCSPQHARLCAARENLVMLEVLDARKRAAQLRGIEIAP